MGTEVKLAGAPVIGKGDWSNLKPRWLYEEVSSETDEIKVERIGIETFATPSNHLGHFDMATPTIHFGNGIAIIFVNAI